jgi:hypothetical protein
MTAILVWAEITVNEIFGEMDVTECVSSAESELPIVPRKPAQPFGPFALS